jgi:hypothetical protein
MTMLDLRYQYLFYAILITDALWQIHLVADANGLTAPKISTYDLFTRHFIGL